jgi:hypothetical protein
MPFKFHPLANLFPLIEGADFDELVADMKANGLAEPIDILQGKILDGRNRYRACEAAGIELQKHDFRHFRPEISGDPLAYVISKNLKRRHLNDIQRASVAGKIANLSRGRPPENPPIGGFSTEQAATKLNVAPRQVERARVVHDQGIPELRAALDRGQIAVAAAEHIARLPEQEQGVAVHRAIPNGARAIMSSRQEPDDSLDYFPTPPWATRALLNDVWAHLGTPSYDATVWEPACGEGHIAEVLGEYFGAERVVATDLFDYGYGGHGPDFLTGAIGCPTDWIITNPPFGDKAIQFVLRALDLATVGVAMFFRSQWAVEGVERYQQIFKNHAPTLCAFFVERVPLCKGRWDPDGTTATAYCWLVWVKGQQPKPPFWIPPDCRKRLTLPTDRERFAAWSLPKQAEADCQKGEAA